MMTSSSSLRRRAGVPILLVIGILGLLALFVLSRSHGTIAQWAEPVRSEIPSWVLVGLGISPADPLPDYHLMVEPEVLRAARLMLPSGTHALETDHWWFPARAIVDARSFDVEAQLVVHEVTGETLHVRFSDGPGPFGVREIELEPLAPEYHLHDLVAREAAARAGVLAAPGGFARVRINGSEPRLVHWREGSSEAMLQRLGMPEGEIFRATPDRARGHRDRRLPSHYASTLSERAPAAHARALSRFVELVREADDTRFEEQIRRVVDVEQVLAWDAIERLFAGAGPGSGRPAPAPDWYFDPVTGLLRPVIRSVVASASNAGAVADADRLVERLLQIPHLRARRDALLREWVGITRAPAVAEADEGFGTWASRLAASHTTLARVSELTRLARLRRATRHALDASADTIRQQLADAGVWLAIDSVLEPSHPLPNVEEWIASTGLPLRIEHDALVLPAGRHQVEHSLIVPASHRLVIEPGAELVMAPDTSIVTFRGLRAVGTREAPIAIRALDPEDPWGAIGVARAPERSELAYVTVSGGSAARHDGIEFTGELAFNASDVRIRDCDVRDAHGDDALSVRRAAFQVARTRFIDNASDGFDAEWTTGAVEQSLFANNGDDGLDLATSEVRVHRGWFRRMGDKAISAGERSRVAVSDSSLVDSQIAIASKEDSRVEVQGSEFRRNEIGISLYRDNRIFGSGYGTVTGGLFAENLRDFAVETGSGLTLNGVERLESGAAGVVIGLRDVPGPAPSAVQ